MQINCLQMERGDISVVVPVFGHFTRWRLLDTVLNAWAIQTVRPTVWLAYQGPETHEGLLEKGCGAAHHIVHLPSTASPPSPGCVRNGALARVRAAHCYVTDADVLPRRDDYLARCLEFSNRCGAAALTKPGMVRVRASEASFSAWYDENKHVQSVEKSGQCIQVLREGRLHPSAAGEVFETIDGDVYCCTKTEKELLNKYAGREDDLEELIMKPTVHWGGLFARMDAIRNVGGYGEVYVEWGCEDDDLHYKLASTVSLNRLHLPDEPQPLLHLEHPRTRNTESYRQNLRRFADRKQMDFNSLLASDRLAFARHA
jgi:hypothetical protein